MAMNNSIFQWQPFGLKAKRFLANSDKWINITVGSIRSGKTITVLTRFIEFMLTSPNEDFMIIGKTLNALERNVIKPLKKMLRSLGIEPEHNRYLNELYFAGNTVCLFGVGKKGDDEKIQGSTFAGTFIDEATVIPEEGFKMILSRNSIYGAKIFITCNPANPRHYLYTEYITNKKMHEEGRCEVWTFELSDNLTLSDEYVENLKASYPEDSLFYKRYILGLWVSGQGAIYSHFDKNNLYNEDIPLDWFDYIEFGSDYGAGSTTCWTIIGIKEFEDHNEYWVIDEGGHNKKKAGYSLTDYQIVEMIRETQEHYHFGIDEVFYTSHDATSLEAELYDHEGIRMTIGKFTPKTLDCISKIENLFYLNHIHIHERCVNLVECIESYEWDANAARRGETKPSKVEDHYCDALRAPIMNHLFEDAFYSDLVYL